MRFRAVFAITALVLVALTSAADAAFPGASGKIAYVSGGQIWAVNPDGTGNAMLIDVPNGPEDDPAWSADGQRIAFRHTPPEWSGPEEIWIANSDGSDPTLVVVNGRTPTWSPDGQRIAFARLSPSTVSADLYTVRPDGTDLFLVADHTLSPATYPTWSPDGTKIATDGVYYYSPAGSSGTYIGGCCFHPDWSPFGDEIAFIWRNDGRLYRRALDGTHHMAVSPGPIGQAAFSPDGTEFAYWVDGAIKALRFDGTASRTVVTIPSGPPTEVAWQPIPTPPARRYVRPRGATPLLASLVPAYTPCDSPNRGHGPPLAFGSCDPPQQTSTTATVGTADANGWPARSVGFVSFEAVAGNPDTAEDEAAVAITVRISDVRYRPSKDDYTFGLDVPLSIRLTDGSTGAFQTTMPEVKETDYALWYGGRFRVTVPCARTADPAEGGLCTMSTSADAFFGAGAVKERDRAMWQLDQIRVFDSGPDGFVTTRDDNELFAVQGVFVP